MDVPADTAVDASRPAPERLMPLGIAMLGWLVCAGVLAMVRAGPGSGVAAGDRGGTTHLGQFLIPLVAGLLCQSSVARRSPESRVRYAGMLWATWILVGFAAWALPGWLGLHAPWSVVDLGLQQAGLVAGIVGGWMGATALASRLLRVVKSCEAITRAGIVVASVLIVLIPVAPEALLLDPVHGWQIGSPRGYAKAISGQLYLALKSVILWVPLGMLCAIAQKQVQARTWTLAGALALLLVGLPLLVGTLVVRDVMEILGAYWGIALGILLGIEVLRAWPEPGPGGAGEPVPAAAATIPAGAIRNEPQSVPIPADATRNEPQPASIPADATRSEPHPAASGGKLLRRITAVGLLLGVAAWSWFFPRWALPLTCCLGLYTLLLWRYRHAWLLVVPVALPLLNLVPGTGRFFFDEFDLLLVTTVAMALWHGPGPAPRPVLPRRLTLAFALFGISVTISLVIGLLPLSPVDANAFASYWSHYNSLRVAKGFLWAVPLGALLFLTLPSDAKPIMGLFVPGMWLGLAGVIAAGLWERALFASLLDLDVRYRITATFSSMHTGGSEIETYLVTAIPFVWLAFRREGPAVVKLAGLGLLVVGAYLMTLTIARGGVLALAVAICVLAFGAWRTARAQAGGKRGIVVTAVALGSVAVALAIGLSGGYLQKRLAHSEEDWGVRVDHWQKALAMRDDGWIADLLGMGLGRFPETYLYRSGDARPPGTYRFADGDGNSFLSLGSGETLYMAQRVAVTGGGRYTLSLRARSSDANARLGVPVCEKNLLNSFRCQWQGFALPADGAWHERTLEINSGAVGEGNWLVRRPVELSLYNENERTRIDVDDVQLTDESGNGLISNGDFSAGGDNWFFKTHSHLPWHIKNLWVAVLFEQGWLGLLSLVLLLATVLWHLAQATWRGERFATVLLAATGGYLTVGVFGSPFDAPRIATLFFLLVALAGVTVAPGHRGAHRDRGEAESGREPSAEGR